MKIALVMPPLDTGERGSNSIFRLIHDFARARPYWNRIFLPISRKISFFDLDFYPNGLVQLGTILKPYHKVKIFNFLLGDWYEELINFSPQIVGISCSGGGNLVWVDKFCRKLKKDLNCLIFLGGPHVTLTPEETLRTTVADYIFIGEADLTISQVVDYIEGKTDSLPESGIGYRKNGNIIVTPLTIVEDLSILPVPDHSLVDLSKYKSIGVELSRGCPNRCSFCYLSGYEKHLYWRPRPVESILSEIDSLNRLTNMSKKRIYFVDANFAGDIKRIKLLLKEIIKRNIKISFWTGLDINIDEETLLLMKKAGCSFIYVGIETGCQDRLKKMTKIRNIENIENFIKRVKKVGISTTFQLMLLLPGEDKEGLYNTLRLCKRISKYNFGSSARLMNLTFYLNIFRPVPNTIDTKMLIAQGWHSPSSFAGWGRLYDRISNGKFEGVNFTKDINKRHIIWALLYITILNLRQILRPNTFSYGYKKIKNVLLGMMRRITMASILFLLIYFQLSHFEFKESQASVASLKILIIGIDGADKEIIEKLIDNGELPNISSLIAKGEIYGLKPEDRWSPSIWTSMLTGKKSNQHRITSFIGVDKYNQIVLSPPSYMRKAESLWNILTKKNIKSLFIAFPCTWPEERIYGYMVSQIAIPRIFFYKNHNLVKKSSFQRFCSYYYKNYISNSFKWDISSMIPPLALLIEEMDFLNIPIEFSFVNTMKVKRIVRRWYKKELHKILQIYNIKNPIVLPYTSIFSLIDLRKLPLLAYVSDKLSTDIAIKIMKEDPQLELVALFMPGLDIFQEYLLPDARVDGPYRKNLQLIFNYYKFIDSNIRQLVKNIDKNTKVVIVSDHGIGIDLVKDLSNVREGIFICSEKLNLSKEIIAPHEVFDVVLSLLNLPH